MVEKKDNSTIKYGEMNKLYENQDVKPTVDMSEQNFTTLVRSTIKNNLVNTDMSQGRRLAFILQKIPQQKGDWFDSLFENPIQSYYVRIPELDAHLPQPKVIGEPARKGGAQEAEGLSDQDIIEMHQIYEPKSDDDDLSNLLAGDRVWVAQANGKNIIIESLGTPPVTDGGKGGSGPLGSIPSAKNRGQSFRGGSFGGARANRRISLGNGGLHPSLSKDLPMDTAKEIAAFLIESGSTEQAAANILAMIHGDSSFRLIEEPSFTDEPVTKIRNVFGSRTEPLSDEQLENLKKDDIRFYDHVYSDIGGHKYKGRGFLHISGQKYYRKLTEDIGSGVDDFLLEPSKIMENNENSILAIHYYYYILIAEASRTYEDFHQVYIMTKGINPKSLEEGGAKDYYSEDYERRRKYAEGWLDYIGRNVTFSIKPSQYIIAPGGAMVAGSEEMQLATELHNAFLTSYVPAISELKRNNDTVVAEKSSPQIDLEQVELSQLIQFPIGSNGYNFITPLQGMPDYGSEFLGVRGKSKHLAMDQFVPDSNMTTKIRAIAPGKVTLTRSLTSYDGRCKLFQKELEKHFYGNEGICDKAAAWRVSKGYPTPPEMIAAWKAHSRISLPNNHGEMGWNEYRAWLNSHVPNNSTKFGSSFLRYMHTHHTKTMSAGGASVTVKYDADHNGITYAHYSCHMDEIYVTDGQRVEQGQVLGLIGDSAIFDNNCKHLHFQMESFEGETPLLTGHGHSGYKNRINPRELIPAMSMDKNNTKIKFEGVYSPTGTWASKQTSRYQPAPVISHDFELLRPYVENRVKISEGYEAIIDPTDPRLVEAPTIPGRAVRKVHVLALDRFMQLSAAAVEAGFDPPLIASGWRRAKYKTREEYDAAMIEKYGSVKAGRAWVAFRSPHMTGLALDFGNNGLYPTSATNETQKQSPFFNWLKENAYRYGFTPYKTEAWHWEVKVPLDAYASGDEFTDEFAVKVMLA